MMEETEPPAVHLPVAGTSTSTQHQVAIQAIHQPSAQLPSQIVEVRRQVDEVVQVMRKNLERMEEREANLNELSLRAETLEQSAREFQTSSAQLQKTMWWRDFKWRVIAIATVVAIVSIIIIVLVVKLS